MGCRRAWAYGAPVTITLRLCSGLEDAGAKTLRGDNAADVLSSNLFTLEEGVMLSRSSVDLKLGVEGATWESLRAACTPRAFDTMACR